MERVEAISDEMRAVVEELSGHCTGSAGEAPVVLTIAIGEFPLMRVRTRMKRRPVRAERRQ
jgi:hypothetical protein